MLAKRCWSWCYNNFNKNMFLLMWSDWSIKTSLKLKSECNVKYARVHWNSLAVSQCTPPDTSLVTYYVFIPFKLVSNHVIQCFNQSLGLIMLLFNFSLCQETYVYWNCWHIICEEYDNSKVNSEIILNISILEVRLMCVDNYRAVLSWSQRS